ncbi:MAG: ABC transporter substrate-binding protein [Candidatus Acetothermia bacterium]
MQSLTNSRSTLLVFAGLLLLSLLFVGTGSVTTRGQDETLNIITEVGSHTDAWKSVRDQFEAEHNVKVEVNEFPFDQFREQLSLKFSAGDVAFDLAYIPIGWVPQFLDNLTPVEDQGSVDTLELDDFAGIENAYFGEDELYFVPYMNETHGVLYRKDLFNDPEEREGFKDEYGYSLEPPKTMSEYHDIAEFFHRPDEGLYGVSLMGDRSILLGFHFYNRLFNHGGDILDEDYRPAFNNEAGVKALKELEDLFEYTSAAATSYGWQGAQAEFLQGRSAMAEMATTIAQIAQDQEQSKVVGDVGFTGIPTTEAGVDKPKRLYLPFGFVITQDSDQKELAFEWIKHATSKEYMKEAAPVGNIPARYSVLRGEIAEEYPYYSSHADAMEQSNLEPLPLIPEGATVTSEILPTAISSYLTGDQTAEEVLEQAASKTRDLMEENGYYD